MFLIYKMVLIARLRRRRMRRSNDHHKDKQSGLAKLSHTANEILRALGLSSVLRCRIHTEEVTRDHEQQLLREMHFEDTNLDAIHLMLGSQVSDALATALSAQSKLKTWDRMLFKDL